MRGHPATGAAAAHQAGLVRAAIQRAALMDACSATRLLVPSFLVGMSVSSIAGSDLLGWIAAAFTIAGVIAVRRVRGTASACTVEPPQRPERVEVDATEPAAAPPSRR